MAVGLVGGVDDERNGVPLQVGHLAQVEDDVEVALGVDQVAEHGAEERPAVGADLALDGDDDGAAGAADAEAGPGTDRSPGGFACRNAPFPSAGGPNTW